MVKFVNKSFFVLLAIFLIGSSPHLAFASGIGVRNFNGDVTIANNPHIATNFIGIQVTTTNAASIANNTLENLWIFSNNILDSERHGIKIDLTYSGAITIENNHLDNSNVPSTSPYTKNGLYGVRIKNHPSPSIANNTIRNFGRSGIMLQSISNVTVTNNYLYSNGSQDYFTIVNEETLHNAAGIQALDSVFVDVSYNAITSNLHAGIAAYGSTGIIGPDNRIQYDGKLGLSGGGSGGMEDCIVIAGGAGSYRGGILVRGLEPEEEMSVMCTNTISNNYSSNVIKQGEGTVYYCGIKVSAFFASADQSVLYFDDDSGHIDLDCSDYDTWSLTNNTIDAAGKAFGIIIAGSLSNVTVSNCTVKNAAMDLASAAFTGDNSIVGAGIFIANDATPYIHDNYIFSNGWGVLDDRIYTEAGASGVQMRCAGAQTSIVNNILASNKNDGIVGRETGGLIGLVNMGNTFRNNGRGGIGIYEGMPSRNLEIAYNTIHNNRRGIGATNFDGDMFTISNNIIYSNQGTSSISGSGISFCDLVSTGNVVVSGNSIYDNIDLATGGAGGIKAKNAYGTISLVNNYIAGNMGMIGGVGITALNGTVSFVNNQIMNNIGSSNEVSLENVGGIGFNAAAAAAFIYLDSNTLDNNKAMVAGGPERGRVGAIGFSISNATVSLVNNSISNNNAICIGGVGFDLFGGTAYIASNYIYSNINNKSDWGAGGLAFDEAYGNITVSGNSIYNNQNLATGSGGLALNALLPSASILIDSNNVFGNTGKKAGGIGVMLAGSGDVTISNNDIFSNIGVAGIGVAGNPQFTVLNNTIKNNFGVGIGLGDGSTPFAGLALIDGNTINNNEGDQTGQYGAGAIGGLGLNSAQVTITNNYIYSHVGGVDNEKSGIGFSLSNFSTPLVIANNTMVSNDAGSLGLAGCQGDINIYSNSFFDGLAFIDNTAGDINISVNNITGSSVKTNLITDADVYATVLANDNDRVSIINNTIDGNHQSWNGVMTVCKDNQNGFEISGNTFKNALKNGLTSGFVHIDTSNGRSTGRVHHNVFRGNRWRGIAMFNPVNVSIYNNTIYSNGQGNGERAPSCNSCHRFPDQSPPSADLSASSAPDTGIAISRQNRNIAMSAHVFSNLVYSNDGDAVNISTLQSNSYISIYNNTIGSSSAGNSMMGIGLSHTDCDADIFNNKVINNGDTAIGLSYFSGSANIDGNTINNNTSSTSAAGIGISMGDTTDLTIRNNLIDHNVGSVGGIGITDSYGQYYIGENNIIFSNSGFGIGVNNTESVNIYSSSIRLHDVSGINFSLTGQITLRNNTIQSNGSAESYQLDANEERNASGVRARDSLFYAVEGNTIKNHLYTAISVYGTDGYIGPNNTFQNNGSGEDQISDCSSLTVYGEGDGAVSVRGLTMGDTLIVSDNYITDNVVGSVRCRDGMGDVRFNGKNVQCGLWDKYETKLFVNSDLDIFVDGVSVKNSSIVDCQDPLIPDTISNGAVWGIAILAGTNTVTVRNCTIENNMTVGNTKGPDGNSLGGGLLIGPDTDAYVHNNIIRNNGFEVAADGRGGNVGLSMRCSGSGTRIWSNYIYSNVSDGINARDISCSIGGDSPATKNYIYNNGRSGITLKDITAPVSVAYNDIYSNNKVGLAMKDSSNVTLDSLTIYSNGQGQVAVRPVSDIDPGTPPDAGIILNGCDAVTLKNLIVRNNDGFGISLSDMLSNEDVTITSSLIGGYNNGNTRSGIGVGVFGWGMETNLGIININDHINSNTISYNKDIGLGFFNYGGEVNIVGNIISSNEGDGVAHTWAPGAIGLFEPVAPKVNIERNRIYNNYSAGVIGRANSRVAVIAAQMNSSGTGLLIDNVDSGCTSSGVWTESSSGCYYGTDVLSHDADGSGDSVTWTPTIPARKEYNVYARWRGDSINNLSSVAYTINNFNGVDIVNVDQQDEEFGCDWALLGRYEFDVGTSGYVKLSVDDTVVGSTVSADAVRFGEIVTLSIKIKGNHIENNRPNSGYQRYVPAIGFDDVDFVNSTISSGLVVEDNLIDSGNYYSFTLQGTSGDVIIRNNEIRAMVLMQNNTGQISFIDNPLIRNMSRRRPESYVFLGRYNSYFNLHNNVINGYWYNGANLSEVIRLRGSTIVDWSGNDISGSNMIRFDGPSGEIGPNNTFHNITNQGLWNRGGSWLNVHDNEFYAIGNGTDTGRYADGGLRLTAFNNLTIANNDFHDINGAGVWLYNRGSTTLIKGNTFRNNLNGFKTRYPRGTYNMEDNLFYSNWNHGINIYQQTSNVTWNWIGDNRIYSNRESGISIYQGTRTCVIENLTIYSNGSSGRNPSDGGIRIRDTDNVIVRNNTIRNNLGFGIANADALVNDDITITDNLIVSNEFSGIGVAVYERTSNLGNYYINDSVGPNIIRNNKEGGIGIYSFKGNATIQGNTIFNNTNTNTGLMSGPSGIGLFELASADITIADNYVYSNSTVVTAGGIGASLQLVSGAIENLIDDVTPMDFVVDDSDMAVMDFEVTRYAAAPEFTMIGTNNWINYGTSRRHNPNQPPYDDKAIWTPDVPTTADYKLFTWWYNYSTSWSNRAAYTINYNGGSTIINMNQESSSGFWNYLDTFNFAAGTSNSISLVEDDEGYVLADKVGFLDPTTHIPFITRGDWIKLNVNSEGYGSTYKRCYRGDLYDRATWTPDIPTDGRYKVFSRWYRNNAWANNASFTVFHEGGYTEVSVNQYQGGGIWYYLGEYDFLAGTDYRVEVTGNAQTNKYVVADAVGFVNTLNNLSFYAEGDWLGEVNASAYGGHHRYSAAGTGADVAIWTPTITTAGDYDVWVWWVQHSNRATNAPYTIYYNGGADSTTVNVNQEINGSRWNHLGTYYFTAGTDNRIELSDNANQYVIADALAITQGGPPATEPSNLTITNNKVEGNSGFGIAVNAMSLNYIEIDGNEVYSHPLGALSYSSIGTPAEVTVSNNTLLNENTSGGEEAVGIQLLGGAFDNMKPVITYNTVKNFGAVGIQVKNFSGGILLSDNEISLNNRSGLAITLSNGVSIQNNYIYSNGVDDTIINGLQDASGIRARDSVLSVVSDNTIANNMFAGIASYGSPGTIGPNNVIQFDGDPDGTPGDYGGSMDNCVIAGGAVGNIRGGILVRDLAQDEEMTVLCTNTFYSNYFDDVAKIGGGNVISCGNVIASFFATSSDAVVWLEGPTTYNLDCADHVLYSDDNTIDAAGYPFGIVILGSTADVTVQNCTIQNAAMDSDSWIDTGDNSSVGAGIFIANDATPYISNNYIFSNGWGILDDSVVTSSNAGIMLRCAEANTSIVNNVIASNKNDGLALRESGGMIGLVNESNTFRNNGRNGIGVNDGTTRNLDIAFNYIHNNIRGIGTIDFDNNTLSISNNIVYSNLGNSTSGGGVGFINLSGTAVIDSNTVRNNSGPAYGGIGVTLANSGGSLTISNNLIEDNIGSAGGIGFADSDGTHYIVSNTVKNNTGDVAGGIGATNSNATISIYNNMVYSNTNIGVGFSYYSGTSEIYSNTIRHHDSIVSGHTTNSMGIGISYPEQASFNIYSNTMVSNATGLGITGEDMTSTYSCEVLFRNNEVSALKSPNYFGITSQAISFIGSGLVVDSNDENGGFHDLDDGLSLYLYVDGKIDVVNNNIFSNCNEGIKSIGGTKDINIDNNRIRGGVEIQNSGGPIKITDNEIYCFGGDCRLSAVQPMEPFRSAIRLVGQGGNINISGNTAETDRSANGAHDLISLYSIATSDSEAVTISNNVLRGAISSGIRIGGLPTTSNAEGHRIYSNVIYNIGPGDDSVYSEHGGIALINTNDLTLFNNDIYSNEGGGISLADATTSLCVIGSYAGSGGPVMIGLVGQANTIRNNKNGVSICGTTASSPVTVAYNEIYSNQRSGISFTIANGVTIENNFILSNGFENYYSNGMFDGSGIRAMDSVFELISGNTIRNNRFSGIASFSTGGIIGPNNVIMYDGDSSLPSPGEGGKATDCVSTSGGGGNVRGGILIRDLDPGEEMSVMCTNTITSNYYKDIAYTGGYGTITSCGNAVLNGSFFADAQDAIFYFDQDTAPDNLDCLAPAPEFMAIYSIQGATIDAAGKPFGIIVVGGSSDVTISNCTIKNAAMADEFRATVDNKFIGAGIFLANDATPSISNNYIFSNGWALLDDRIYTESGASGIQMRCAEGNTSIVNNIIAYNKSNGLVGYETGGLIGVVNQGNTFRNNSGSGIGIYDGLTGRNLEIAYNTMFSNRRGIAMADYDGDMFTAKNNDIFDHKRSGMSFTASNEIVIQNNTIINNGMDDIYSNGQHDASGIRAMDSFFRLVEGNTIKNNKFSGIASYGTAGTIGNNNIIMYDGVPSSDPVGGGGVGDCVITGGGDVRGGILVRDLKVNEEMTILCTNTIKSNYNNDLAKIGPGVMSSCGNVMESFFATADDAVYYYSGSDSVVHDCGGSTINAAVDKGAPVPFGIIIVGSFTDVTVHNCTIKNAAMNESARATVDNSGVINYMGSGIFVANGAPSYISSNYIYSNGWGLFEDRIYTDSGSSGVMLRCGAGNTTLVGNIIASNLNDGLSGNETGGLIGVAGLGNTFRNNGRGGIGLVDGIDRNLEISYNVFHNNQRGISGIGFTGDALTISYNIIYSNQGNQTNQGGGIGFTLSNLSASIYSNTIRNNSSSTLLNKGVAGIGIADSTLMNDLTIAYNYIASNTYTSSVAGVGGIGFTNLYSSGAVWVSIGNNQVLNNGWGEIDDGAMAGGIGNISAANTVNWFVDNNTISGNIGLKAGGFGSSNSGGEITFTNNTVSNNMVYDFVSSGASNSYMGPGLGLRDSTTSLYVYGSYFSGNTAFSSGNSYVGGAVGIFWNEDFATTTNGKMDYLTFVSNKVTYNGLGALTVSGVRPPSFPGGPRFSVNSSILVSNNVFSDSSVSLLKISGIYSATAPNPLPRLVISRNTFYNASGPGGMGGPSAVSLDRVETFNNVLRDNLIEDTLGICNADDPPIAGGCSTCSSGKGFNTNNGVGYLSIFNNTIRNLCSSGMQLLPMDGVPGSYAGENRIYNNYIYNNGGANLIYSPDTGNIEVYGKGIGISGNAVDGFISIYNNTIESNVNGGIGIRYTDQVVIYSNTVNGNKRGGIGFTSCGTAGNQIMVSGNSIYNNTNTVTQGTGGVGFNDFTDGTVSIVNNFIDNNVGSTGGVGLKNISGTFYVVGGNTITNNSSQATGSGGFGASQAATGSSIIIQDNTINSNSSTQAGGVGYDNSDGTFYIADNTINNNNSTAKGSGGIGFSLVNSNSNTTIVNNLIDGNIGSTGGIGMADSGGSHYLYNNSVTNNTGDVVGGIGFTNSNATLTISNNLVYSNPKDGMGFSYFSGTAQISNNVFSRHNSNLSGHSTNSMGIGIDHPKAAHFTIENNVFINNATGLGIIGEEFTSTYSCELTFKNNEVKALNLPNYFGLTGKAVSFIGPSGLLIDSNDENEGFHFLNEGVSLGADVVGDINIVNGNVFSYCNESFKSEDGNKNINIDNNRIHGSIAINNSGGTIRIVDNIIDCFGDTCAVISQAPFEPFRSVVRIYEASGDIDISRNFIESDQSVVGAHDLVSIYKLGAMDNTEALTISNNTLRGAVSSGLRIGDLPTTNVPGGHAVYSNIIYSISAGEHWVYSQNSAIALLNVNDLTLYNNTIHSCLGDAISLSDSSNYSCLPGVYDGSGGPVTIGISGKPNSIHNNSLGGINICGTGAASPVTIAYNEIYSNFRSGISFTLANNVSVLNNNIYTNGLEDYELGGEHDASAIRAKDSFLSLVSGNSLRNHQFSGIAAYNTGGTLQNNVLQFNGIYTAGGHDSGGDMNNCVRTPGGSGSMRGAIMAKDLGANTLEICNNDLVSNYYKEIGHTGTGTITSCGVAMTTGNLFVDSSDAIFYFDGDSGQVNLDCSDYDTWSLTNATIDASGLPFGIIIEGSASDVTVQNCTVKNAAADIQYAATTGNASIVGAGIFIANNATPFISNNYIISNGWALLDDRIYTEAGASGIQMRCSETQTSILNNIIASNTNGGIIGRESGGLIGLLNQGNTFRNNGGNGIGLYDSTTRNLEIAYNNFTGNLRGIGVADYDLGSDGLLFTIANNDISANWRSGISFTASNGIIIKDNDIISNGLADYMGGGRRDASGIRGRESTFGEVTGNTIRNNLFAGVSSYDTDGTLGPDNVIRYNGNTGEVACSELSGPGGGDGGVAVRDLDMSDTLIVSGNVIENNYLHTITRKDGNGTVRLDGSIIGSSSGGYWDADDAGVFITATGDVYTNGNLARTGNAVIDCANDPDIPTYLSGNVWGVAIEASAASVTIKNCDIFNNNTTINTLGPGGTNMGGGIFVGPGVHANIYSNRIFSNGAEIAPTGQSGSCGVLLFCAASNTQVWNNVIASNASDGLDARNFLGVIGGADPSYKNTIRFNNRNGIGISGVSDVTIEHNEVYSNFGIAGIGMVDEAQVTIRNNTVRNNTGVGIGLGDGAPAFSGYAQIEGNLIHHNQGLAFAGGSGEMCNPCGDSKYVGGIGARDMDGANVLISGNEIYSQNIYEALSIAFRYDGPGNNSDVMIYSNYMPDNTDEQLAIAFSNICTGLPPASDCASTETVTVDKNDVSQQLQFLRTGDLTVANNILKTGTWTYFFMASGAINVQHQYISKPDTTVGNKVYIYNNTIDLENRGTKGIMIRSDSSDYIGYADVYSNLIINCRDSIVTSATTVRGAGISFGLFGFEYQVTGSIVNNTIDSGYDGIVGLYPKDLSIIGNTVSNMLHRGIRLAESEGDFNISGNVLYSSGVGSNADAGIQNFFRPTFNSMIIDNNQIWGIDGRGISLFDVPAGKTVSISNNTIGSSIGGVIRGGIRIDNSAGDVYILDNTIVNNDRGAVGLRDATSGNIMIAGNEIYKNANQTSEIAGASGIGITNNNAVITITNNNIHSNTGLFVGAIGFSYASGSGVWILDNYIYSNIGENIGGIGTSTSSNATAFYIDGNTVGNNTATSITLGAGGIGFLNNDITVTSLTNNTVKNNSGFAGGIGLAKGSGDTLWILNNWVYSNIGENIGGIGTSSTSNSTAVYINGNTVENNTSTSDIQGAGGVGFLNNDSSLSSLTNNTIRNNSGFTGGIGFAKGSGDTLWVLNNWVYSNIGEIIGGIGTNSCSNSASVYIDGNTIENNTSTSGTQGAGGIGFGENGLSTLSLSNNTIQNNSGHVGGIGLGESTLTNNTGVIQNNYIFSNTPNGLQIKYTSSTGYSPKFLSNTFKNNSSGEIDIEVYSNTTNDQIINSNRIWATTGTTAVNRAGGSGSGDIYLQGNLIYTASVGLFNNSSGAFSVSNNTVTNSSDSFNPNWSALDAKMVDLGGNDPDN